MASTSKLPTPSVDGMDTLSDYIPQSNEISRVPSTAGDPTPAPAAGPSALGQDNGGADDDNDEVADDDESEYDSEGDKVMKTGTGEKKVSQKKEAKRKLDDKLASRRTTQATLKSSDSIKRFTYLLGQTDLFKHFCDLKAQRDPDFAKLLEEASAGKAKGRRGKA